MARRQPNTGSTTVFYEDFQPKSELKEEDGAHLLLVYIPEFSKDQIRVMYVHTIRTVIVRGERPLGNDKWSRFNQNFPVPQNCIVEKIQAKFQDGIVTITMPKQTTSPPQQMERRTNISPKDSNEQWNSASEPPTKSAAQQNTSPASQTPQKPVSEPQVQTDTSAKETPKQSIRSDDGKTEDEEKRVDASKAPYQPKLQKQDETPPVKETDNTTEKQTTLESKTESINKSEKSAEIAHPKGLENTVEEVMKEISFIEKARETKNVAAAAIKTALEDRQFIANMAVAVSVILAVGAYVTYSIRSFADATD